MKWVIGVCLSLLCLFAGCEEGTQTAVTFLTGTNVEFEEETVEYIGRVGPSFSKGLELGFASNWCGETDRQTYGVYAIQALALDPNTALLSNVYLGAMVTVDFDDDGGMYGPIIGTVTNYGGIEIVTEFQYREYNEALSSLEGNTEDKYKVYIGPRFKF